MNALKKTAIKFGLGVLIDVMKEAITLDSIKGARNKVIDLGFELTGKTDMEWDDNAWRLFSEKILTPENWSRYGKELVEWAIAFVKDSATQIDDRYALPLLLIMQKVMNSEEVDG